jgi:predicted restriction endonuclease
VSPLGRSEPFADGTVRHRRVTTDRIRKAYPQELPWGKANIDQHAAFQAMWAQYDHIRPHSHGGTSDLDNIVVTCAPCNFGRMSFSLEEVGLADPRAREPVTTAWDGLERFR